jgi:tetrahydromethanopterin S-methyltransferase subunit B
MATNTHGNLTGDEVHVPYRQVFADAAARTGDATTYDSDDLYKKALQLDTLKEYVLTSISPTTWSALN